MPMNTPLRAADLDAQETREWLDALTAVIEKEGPERAHFLLEQLLAGPRAQCGPAVFGDHRLCEHD